jgi:hypothetical protein
MLPDYGIRILLSLFREDARRNLEAVVRHDYRAAERIRIADTMSVTTMYGGGDEWDDVDFVLVAVLLVLLRVMIGG